MGKHVKTKLKYNQEDFKEMITNLWTLEDDERESNNVILSSKSYLLPPLLHSAVKTSGTPYLTT